MNCPCDLCQAREFFDGVTYKEGRYVCEEPPEEEVQEPVSVWERLVKLSQELKRLGAPSRLVNEVNDICDTVDLIDSEVVHLQKQTKGKEIELGEISKRLY